MASTTVELNVGDPVVADGYEGVAFRIRRFATNTVPTISYGWDAELEQEYEFEDWSETDEVEDRDRVVAVMVGDDREFTFDITDVHLIPDEFFCHVCGAIGCRHDGLERD